VVTERVVDAHGLGHHRRPVGQDCQRHLVAAGLAVRVAVNGQWTGLHGQRRLTLKRIGKSGQERHAGLLPAQGRAGQQGDEQQQHRQVAQHGASPGPTTPFSVEAGPASLLVAFHIGSVPLLCQGVPGGGQSGLKRGDRPFGVGGKAIVEGVRLGDSGAWVSDFQMRGRRWMVQRKPLSSRAASKARNQAE